MSRGWISSKDNANNTNFYLYINKWIFFTAPHSSNTNELKNIILNTSGDLGSYQVIKDDGGVHIFSF